MRVNHNTGYKEKKVMKKVYYLTCLLSFIFMLSTAGASDLELISPSQVIFRLALCLVMLCLGVLGVRACNIKEAKRRRMIIRHNNQRVKIQNSKSIA